MDRKVSCPPTYRCPIAAFAGFTMTWEQMVTITTVTHICIGIPGRCGREEVVAVSPCHPANRESSPIWSERAQVGALPLALAVRVFESSIQPVHQQNWSSDNSTAQICLCPGLLRSGFALLDLGWSGFAQRTYGWFYLRFPATTKPKKRDFGVNPKTKWVVLFVVQINRKETAMDKANSVGVHRTELAE